MPREHETYTRTLYARHGYLATWYPNTELKLGDVGLVSGDEFSYVTELTKLGIPFDVRPQGGALNIEFASSDDVSVKTKLAGEAPIEGSALAQADAGVVIDFGTKNGFTFSATGLSTTMIADQDSLGREIINRFAIRAWEPDYFVITEIAHAEALTVLIAAGSTARVEFHAKASVNEAQLMRASVATGFEIASASDLFLQLVTKGRTTPLFRGRRLKKRLFREPQFRDHRQPRLLELEPEDFFGDST